MSEGRPLAIAVIRHQPVGGEPAYRTARAAVQSYAATEGYDVAELFEVFGPMAINRDTVEVLVDLADRVDAHTLLAFGGIGDENRELIATRSDLRIVTVPGPPNAVTAPRGIPLLQAPPRPANEGGVVSSWTGRLDIDLLNGRGWRVATIEAVVRIDSLTLWSGNRTLAVIDRDLFRQWMHRPSGVFRIDDITWSVREATAWISIDGIACYAIRADVFQYLVATI